MKGFLLLLIAWVLILPATLLNVILVASKASGLGLLVKLVSEKYPNGAEMAIQRKGILDKVNEEFVGYNNFVEDVKIKVKSEINGEVIKDSYLAE